MGVEVSQVRKRLNAAMDQARERAQQRRQRAGDAERSYAAFLDTVAVPVARMVHSVLKAENHAFTLFTPAGGLRLANDRVRDDYIELSLDTTGDRPQVLGRISQTRGSRTLTHERPIKPGASPEVLTEEDVLEFFVDALEPWLER
jgi:hypothetical protein